MIDVHLFAFDTESVMWLVGAVVSIVALIATWRGEVLARKPQPETMELHKRIDGFYTDLTAANERNNETRVAIESLSAETRVAIESLSARVVVLEERPREEPTDWVDAAKTLRLIQRELGKVEEETE